jgi:eukaryotic-like serine/threonine-protein kinase
MDGTVLGHFTIVEKLGEGGMGVVYKGRDTRLGRLVAIKALPDSKSTDPERKLRFVQEAKAASALNHSNIITIYDVVEFQEHSYIVMEFVDGKPLSQLIPNRGMKLTEALRVAVQVADALAAAHRAGIVHRDVKPGNIMVDSQGRVKVLDFGLAKLTSPAGTAAEGGSTVVMSAPITEEYTIVGSASYMSPEQAEGLPVDARSDIFSFGAVLYEMISGRRAFAGESWTSTLRAVVEANPKPLNEAAQSIPPELDRLISRCLRKDINKRSQHMSDVRLALEELRDESESGKLLRPLPASPQVESRPRRWVWPLVAATFIGLTAIAGWTYFNRAGTNPVSSPELTRLSPDDGYSYSAPVISADGKLVAYVSDRNGKPELWLQQVGGSTPIQLTHSANAVTNASFFPDGTNILYLTSSLLPDEKGTLEIVPTLGGQPRVLAEGTFGYDSSRKNFAISPDGQRVAYVEHNIPLRRAQLMIIAGDGGPAKSLEAFDETQSRDWYVPNIQWTADNRFILAVGSKQANGALDDWEWFAVPTDGGKAIATGVGDRLRLAGFGITVPTAVLGDRVLFSGPSIQQRHIWEIELSRAGWHMIGNPRQYTFGTENEVASSVSGSGVAAIQTGKWSQDFYLLPLDPASGNAASLTRRLTQDKRAKVFSDPSLLGDGGDPRFAYFGEASETRGSATVTGYSLDLESATQKRITAPVSIFRTAWIASRDGRHIAYSLAEGDVFSISIGEPMDPLNSARVLCRGCGRASAFSPDGRFLLYDSGRNVRPKPDRKATIRSLDVSAGAAKLWLEDPSDSLELEGFTGEGGQWAVVSARDPHAPTTSAHTFLVPWHEGPVGRSEWIAVPVSGAKFSPTGDLTYFFKGAELWAMKFDPRTKRLGPSFEVKPLPSSEPVPRPDDQWTVRGPGIVFARVETRNSVWLMKLPK